MRLEDSRDIVTGLVIEIVFIVVDGYTGTPFDNKTGFLNEGLVFEGKGLDASNGGVTDRKQCPGSADDGVAGGE